MVASWGGRSRPAACGLLGVLVIVLALSPAPARALSLDDLSALKTTLDDPAPLFTTRDFNAVSPADCISCGNSFGVVRFGGRKVATGAQMKSDKPSDVAMRTWNNTEVSTFFIHLQNVNPNTMAVIQKIIGYKLTDYVPDNTFIFTAMGQLATDLYNANIQGLFIGRMVAGLKLSDALNLAAASTTAPDGRRLLADPAPGLTTVPSTLVASIAPPERSALELKSVTSMWMMQLQTIFPPTNREGLGTTIVDSKTIWLHLPKSTTPDQLTQVLSQVLVKDPSVSYVDRRPLFGPPRPVMDGAKTGRTMLNQDTAGILQSGTAGVQPIWDRGLTGRNQLIGIGDSGIDWDHCAFGDATPPTFYTDSSTKPNLNAKKIALYIPYSSGSYRGVPTQAQGDDLGEGHGTHVAGSAAGLGLKDGTYKGMAYDAKIIFSDFGPTEDDFGPIPGDMTFPIAYAAGARIHTNSWGCYNPNPTIDPAACNTYSGDARKIDAFVWENPDFLVLFAAGNDGQYPGETVGSPATCKNCLSVGATVGLQGVIAKFSSRGYGVTDRIKPDVVGPGSQIQSAASDANPKSNNCNLKRMSGTSMATPLVAGATALIRQYLVEGWYPTGAPTAANAIASPPAALIRAMVVASTTHVACCKNDGSNAQLPLPPNQHEGFGQVNLANILRFPDSAFSLYLDYGRVLPHRNSAGYCFTVGDRLPLTVTLAWTDAPGSTASVAPIVNDLDLQVWEFGPGSWYPFYPNTPTFDFGSQRADRVNNVEKVVLQRPNKEIFYYVSVRAFNVPVPKTIGAISGQDYALVVKGDNVKLTTGCPTPPDLGVLSTVSEASYPSPPAGPTTGASIVPRIWLDKAIAQSDLSAAAIDKISSTAGKALGYKSANVRVILFGNYVKDKASGDIRGWVFLDVRLGSADEFATTLDKLRNFLESSYLFAMESGTQYKMMAGGLTVDSTKPLLWSIDPSYVFGTKSDASTGVATPSGNAAINPQSGQAQGGAGKASSSIGASNAAAAGASPASLPALAAALLTVAVLRRAFERPARRD